MLTLSATYCPELRQSRLAIYPSSESTNLCIKKSSAPPSDPRHAELEQLKRSISLVCTSWTAPNPAWVRSRSPYRLILAENHQLRAKPTA